MTLQRGFTLIELAIVLVIMTILIGGLAVPLSAQIQARRIAETKQTLNEAREAIFGYAMAHSASNGTGAPYLPCPNVNGDGLEGPRDAGRCLSTEGFFPWVALGTAAQDAWGNRLRYAVTEDFANSVTGFQNADLGDRQICSTSANAGSGDCGALGNIAANVPVVILSHGPNGWGAGNINGNTLAAPSSNSERENANSDHVDKELVSPLPSNANTFDDLVTWVSADQLRGRICPPGGCP